jgi:hypothetical protein
MNTEKILYKYLFWPMGFSLRQANLFMCKARAISRGRRAAPFDVAQGRELVERGYWNSIPGPEVRLSSQKLPARLTKIPVHRGVAPYAIILLLIFSPLQREPHGPNITKLAIVLSLSVLINRMIQNTKDIYRYFLLAFTDQCCIEAC